MSTWYEGGRGGGGAALLEPFAESSIDSCAGAAALIAERGGSVRAERQRGTASSPGWGEGRSVSD